MSKLVFSHPTGNANVRAALAGLFDAGLLFEFDTCIANFKGTWLDKFSSIPGMAELRRRSFNTGLAQLTKTFPVYEALRLISLRLGLKSLTRHETGIFCIDEVYRHHDLFVSRRIEKNHERVGGVYAYEDGCIQSFKTAHRLGLTCHYDLPIGYWRASQKILQEEAKRWPMWSSTLVGAKNSTAKLNRKDNEILSSDHIYVASSFTAKTLADFHQKVPPVHVIPYGFPDVFEHRIYEKPSNRKLKMLFVGGLSQRKGIADIFKVCKELKAHVELTVVGHRPAQSCEALDHALTGCHYIPSLPNYKILELMRSSDVFLFPSVFEGFGLVITESMSQGTPVITTRNTAGADLIEQGKNGWLIDVASTEQLKQTVEFILNNPYELEKVGTAARESARERPWHSYSIELAAAVRRNTEKSVLC